MPDMISLTQNQRDIALCGAKSFGYRGLRHRSFKAPDFGDFSRGQELFESSNEARIDSVLFVERVVSPFEVDSAAIRFHPVDMVDEREIDWPWNESYSDETVNVESFPLSIAPQSDLGVADAVNAGSENLSVVSLRAITAHANSIKSPDSSKAADFIEAFEFSYAAPFFFDHAISLCPVLAKANYVSATLEAQ